MGPEHPVLVHKPEGCIFLWIWFRDLPISAEQLYFKLKEKGVLIIPGHLFFPGQEVTSGDIACYENSPRVYLTRVCGVLRSTVCVCVCVCVCVRAWIGRTSTSAYG